MGIEIFTRWKGQTDSDVSAQVEARHYDKRDRSGFLGESYECGPYATQYLCSEAFVRGYALIPSAVLRKRLPRTLALAKEREIKLRGELESEFELVEKHYREWVELCEEKERETGRAMLIVAFR
jgi:hypothetical protein